MSAAVAPQFRPSKPQPLWVYNTNESLASSRGGDAELFSPC